MTRLQVPSSSLPITLRSPLPASKAADSSPGYLTIMVLQNEPSLATALSTAATYLALAGTFDISWQLLVRSSSEETDTFHTAPIRPTTAVEETWQQIPAKQGSSLRSGWHQKILVTFGPHWPILILSGQSCQLTPLAALDLVTVDMGQGWGLKADDCPLIGWLLHTLLWRSL